jgi:hypothetical protein
MGGETMKSARLTAHVFSLALFFCAAFGAVLCAQPSPGLNRPAQTASTPFTALVTREEARFVLPVPTRNEWKWRQPAVKDNAQEYSLGLNVENNGTKYAFGFYLWKHAGAKPQSGSLSDLIKAGQTSVFGRTPEGINRIIRDAGIKSRLDKNLLIITIHGQKNVERLFSARPSEATFEIKVPDESPVSQTVAIVYQD